MKSSTALASLARLRADLLEFGPQCLKIRTKSGDIVPLSFNKAQLYVHERLEAQRARTGRVRAIVVKGRQQGISTYIGARFYHRASLRKGLKVFILTHLQDATDNLFGMVERYHTHNPIRPTTAASSAKELKFGLLDSGYAVGTAGSQAVGRSDTIQLFHGSEAAFWKNAATHFAGVVQTIPDLPDTEIILESTGDGPEGEFHRRVMEALAQEGDYELIFVPWFWQDEYRREVPAGFELDEEEAKYQGLHGLSLGQMVWRRAKIHELGDPVIFKREYPATANEAFEASDRDSFIAADDVVRARKATCVAAGALIIGVDPKRAGKDRFAIAWRRGRKVQKVEGDPSKTDTIRSATRLKTIIDEDKPAAVFMDAGGSGAEIYDVLTSWEGPYKRIVKLVNFGSPPIAPPKRDKDGKPFGGPKNRRAEMWDNSRDWLQDEGGADIPDRDDVQADACAPEYRYEVGTQKLILQSKEEMRAKNLPSTDLWDAIALTFAEPVTDASARKPLVMPDLGIV